jgi:hypothetical protein
MVSLAGMDVAYGASIQLVKTGILCFESAAAPDGQATANALQAFNDVMAINAGDGHALKADYAWVTDVAFTTNTGVQGVYDNNTTSAALPVDQNGTVQDIISVLSVSAITFEGASFTTPTIVPCTPAAGGDVWALDANNELLKAKATSGRTTTLDLNECLTDAVALINANADLTTGGQLGTAYVAKGNSTAATPTSNIATAILADVALYVEVLSLCKVA